jgi:hypothetical protein
VTRAWHAWSPHSNAAPRLVARLLGEVWAVSTPSAARTVCAEMASLLLLVLLNQEWRAAANPFRAVLRRLHDLPAAGTWHASGRLCTWTQADWASMGGGLLEQGKDGAKITADGTRASFNHVYQFVCQYVCAYKNTLAATASDAAAVAAGGGRNVARRDAVLLLYALLEENAAFRAYLFARPDPQALVRNFPPPLAVPCGVVVCVRWAESVWAVPSWCRHCACSMIRWRPRQQHTRSCTCC